MGYNTETKNSIYFWKIIFTLMIITLHFFGNYPTYYRQGYVQGWYIAVEFFFIVSGYLIALKCENKKNNISATQWVAKNISKMYPHYLFSFAMCFIARMFFNHLPISSIIKNFIYSFPEILLIHMAGFTQTQYYNGVSWYVSALILSGYLIYFLITNYKKFYLSLIAPVSIILIYGYYYRFVGNIDVWSLTRVFISDALLRGFAGMSLGVLCFYANRKIRVFEFTKLTYCLSRLIEIFGFLFVVLFSLKFGWTQTDFLMIVVLAVSITLAFLPHNGLIFNNRIVIYLSELTFPIYLNHYLWCGIILPHYFAADTWSNGLFMIYIVIIVIYSMITKYIIDKIRSKINRWFVIHKSEPIN